MERFSTEVGKYQSVFDVAAGYGRVARFLHHSNTYYGIDLNEHFIKHGQNNGLELHLKNILDESSYHRRDVFVLVDIVHHLPEENLKLLFDLVFKYANRKVVIIEPAFVNLSERYGIWAKPIDWFFSYVDYDGFNKIDRWFTNEEYRELFKKKFGSQYGCCFQVRQEQISNHHLVTFTRD